MTDNLPGGLPVAKTPLQSKNPSSNQDVAEFLHGDELGVVAEENPQENSQNIQAGSMQKEQMEGGPSRMTETVPIVELSEQEKVPEEAESWMEKLEKGEEIKLPQPVVHDDQVLVQNVGDDIDETSVVLPLSQEQVQVGLHEKVYSSARWLAEWCVRVAKKLHGKVAYQVQPVEEKHGKS